jgi:hypothetical protein
LKQFALRELRNLQAGAKNWAARTLFCKNHANKNFARRTEQSLRRFCFVFYVLRKPQLEAISKFKNEFSQSFTRECGSLSSKSSKKTHSRVKLCETFESVVYFFKIDRIFSNSAPHKARCLLCGACQIFCRRQETRYFFDFVHKLKLEQIAGTRHAGTSVRRFCNLSSFFQHFLSKMQTESKQAVRKIYNDLFFEMFDNLRFYLPRFSDC